MGDENTGGPPSVAVVGGGIIGLSTAVWLQRAGCHVTVYDPLPPGSGASYGNGGLISPGSCTPIAMPGMLRKVPRWLLDPSGPLSILPAHAWRAAPWLLRWVAASRRAPMMAASAALRALHQHGMEQYRTLLGPEHFRDLIRVSGQVHVWETEHESANDRIMARLLRQYSIPTQRLSAHELHDLIPELTPAVKRALFYPLHGFTVSPQRLVMTLSRLLQEAGGRYEHQRVVKLIPIGGRYRVLASVSDTEVDKVVVASGAWTPQLLQPLDLKLPLEAERGYHVEMRGASIELKVPILHRDRAIGAITMEGGLRVAGTVEIGGLSRPPNERRGEALQRQAEALLPGLRFERSAMWMGHRPSTPDSVPILSGVEAHPGLYVASGHGHTGITAGAVSGRLMSEIVLKQPTLIDAAPYRISRF